MEPIHIEQNQTKYKLTTSNRTKPNKMNHIKQKQTKSKKKNQKKNHHSISFSGLLDTQQSPPSPTHQDLTHISTSPAKLLMSQKTSSHLMSLGNS